jgi:hypothetical protein
VAYFDFDDVTGIAPLRLTHISFPRFRQNIPFAFVSARQAFSNAFLTSPI